MTVVGFDLEENVKFADVQAKSATVAGALAAGATTVTGALVVSGSVVGVSGPPGEGVTTFTFSSDANKVASPAQYVNGLLLVTGAVISATRNIQYPLVAGALLIVNNAEGHSVQIIGATGTGVTVATTKSAMMYCDGTNWVRITPDT